MATITVGGEATSRAAESSITTYTRVWRNGACTGNGTLTSVEIYAGANAITGLKVGTFSVSISGSTPNWTGSTFTNRDYESLGSANANAKTTFTGLSIDAQTNDVLGIIATAGSIDYTGSGGSATPGLVYKSGDCFGAGEQSSITADKNTYICSLYATGATAVAGNPYYYYLQQ
jgi:hypothetical protein